MARSTGDPVIDALYKVRKGRVEFVDVPDLGFAMVDGRGSPYLGDPRTAAPDKLRTILRQPIEPPTGRPGEGGASGTT